MCGVPQMTLRCSTDEPRTENRQLLCAARQRLRTLRSLVIERLGQLRANQLADYRTICAVQRAMGTPEHISQHCHHLSICE